MLTFVSDLFFPAMFVASPCPDGLDAARSRLAGRTHTQAGGGQRARHTHKLAAGWRAGHTHKLAAGSGPDTHTSTHTSTSTRGTGLRPAAGRTGRRCWGRCTGGCRGWPATPTASPPPPNSLSLSLSLTHTPEGACADARSHGSRWFAYPSRRRNVRVAGGIYPSRRRNIRGFTCGRGRAGTTTAWRPQSCSILVEDGTDLTCLRPI